MSVSIPQYQYMHRSLAAQDYLPSLQQEEAPAYPSFLAFGVALYLVGVVVFSQQVRLNYLVQALAVLISVAWFGWSLATARRISIPRPVLWYAVWVAWASVMMPFCPETEPFNIGWGTTFKVCLITLVVSQCVRTRGDVLFCFLTLVLTSGLVFAVDADSVLAAVRYEKYQNVALSRANDTLLANANNLAFFALFAMIGVVACLLTLRSLLLRGMVLLAVPFGFYLLAASGSRKGMASLVIIAAGLYWFHFRKSANTVGKRVFVLLVGIALIAGAIAFIAKMPTVDRMVGTIGERGAFQQEARYVWFKKGLRIAAENPVKGIGIGGFARSGASGQVGTYSHSTVTEVLAATGLPGFAIYFGSHLSMYLLLRRLRRLPLAPRDAALVNCCMVVLCVWIFYSVFAVMVHARFGWPLLGALCGYCAHLETAYCGRSSPAGGPMAPKSQNGASSGLPAVG